MIPDDRNTLHAGRVISPLRIPPEILIEIIDEAANGWSTVPSTAEWISSEWYADPKAYPCERLSDFMLVSFLWYQTILGTPRLWTKMLMDTSHYNSYFEAERALRLLTYCLSKSGELRLDITLAGWSGDHHDLLLPTLLHSCERWHRLTVFSTFEQEMLINFTEMPQLEVLHLPHGLSSTLLVDADALRTLVLRGNEFPRCDFSAFEQSLSLLPQLTSLSCGGIEFLTDFNEAKLDRLEPGLSNLSPLPNLVKLELIGCKLGDFDTRLHANLMRVSPALTDLTFHFATDQRFGPYWSTLRSPVKRLEILPEIRDENMGSFNLMTVLTSVPFVETICWRDCWRDPSLDPATSITPLLDALSLGFVQIENTVAPKLRHVEFEGVMIDGPNLFIFCREHGAQGSPGTQAGEIRDALRITIREGCVYKGYNNDITPFPCVEYMSWGELETLCSKL